MRWRGGLITGLAAVAGIGPVAYPAWLWLRTRNRWDPSPPPEPAVWPGVTALVCAYREVSTIAAKVEDLRRNGYRGPLEILVVADDPETAEVARSAGATVVEPGRRGGKAAAINRGVAEAAHPIVVLSDANTTLRPGSVARLVRWFGGPGVVGVAGEKGVDSGAEGAFWRFESWLKRREVRMGSTIGLVGELAAVRRESFRPLPVDTAVDDLWLALDLVEAGGRIAYEPDAAASESADWTLRDDWERRTRIVAGMLDVAVRRRHLLAPARGEVAAQLWGHRVARASLGPLAHLALLAIGVAAVRRSPAARVVVAGHVAGAVGLVAERGGRRTPAPLRAGGQYLWMQLVGLGGTVRYLRGDRPAVWPKHAR